MYLCVRACVCKMWALSLSTNAHVHGANLRFWKKTPAIQDHEEYRHVHRAPTHIRTAKSQTQMSWECNENGGDKECYIIIVRKRPENGNLLWWRRKKEDNVMLGVGKCVVSVCGGRNQLTYAPSGGLWQEEVIMPRRWVRSAQVAFLCNI